MDNKKELEIHCIRKIKCKKCLNISNEIINNNRDNIYNEENLKIYKDELLKNSQQIIKVESQKVLTQEEQEKAIDLKVKQLWAENFTLYDFEILYNKKDLILNERSKKIVQNDMIKVFKLIINKTTIIITKVIECVNGERKIKIDYTTLNKFISDHKWYYHLLINGKTKSFLLWDLLNEIHYIKYESLVFYPHSIFEKPLNRKMFNTFNGFQAQYIKNLKDEDMKKIDMILSHIKEVWANNNDANYEHILSYLSLLFKEPVVKK